MGSVYATGSEEQKQKWLPQMARFEKIGCFRIDRAARRLRERPAASADGQARGGHVGPQRLTTVDRQFDVVRCFDHLERATSPTIRSKPSSSRTRRRPGFSVEDQLEIEDRASKSFRTAARSTMKDVRVPEANHLQEGKSFRDTARVLKDDAVSRGVENDGVCRWGAFEHAVKYAQGASSGSRWPPSAHSRPSRQDARQHHGLPVPGGPYGPSPR